MEDGEVPKQTVSTESESQDKISRRRFLKGLGVAAVRSVLPAGQKVENQHSPRVEPEGQELLIPPEEQDKYSVAILDIFDSKDIRFGRYESIEGGAGEPKSIEELKEIIPESEDKEVSIILSALRLRYGDHGRSVREVHERTDDVLNENFVEGTRGIDVREKSIGSAVRVDNLEHDELGNPTLNIYVSPSAVSKAVDEVPGKIINLSFELGKISTKYTLKEERMVNERIRLDSSELIVDGNKNIDYYVVDDSSGERKEITEEEYKKIEARNDEREIVLIENPKWRQIAFIDAYAVDEETTYDNLRSLVGVVREHPDRLFVAAGGNPEEVRGRGTAKPDLTEARSRLEQEGLWPRNLLMVGVLYENNGYKSPLSRGCDIYVPHLGMLDQFTSVPASSYATALVSNLAAETGLTWENKRVAVDMEGTKDRLFEMCDELGSDDNPLHCLNREKIRFGVG